jgi:choline dehydrogenase-like flavoprotein
VSVPRSADVVVAGAGTAGAVLAARLASTSMSVIVLEAGRIPARADRLHGRLT